MSGSNERNTLYILDCSAIVYRECLSPNTEKRRINGVPVYAIEKVISMSLSYLLQDAHVALAFDSRSFRKDLHPDYKAGRKSYDEVNYQLDFLYKMLNAVGFPVMKEDGAEADDLIYTLIQEARKSYKRIIIVGNDIDLVHNITVTYSNIAEVSLQRLGMNEDITYNNFQAVTGIPYNLKTIKNICVGDSDLKGELTIGKYRGKEVYEGFISYLKVNQISYDNSDDFLPFLQYIQSVFTDITKEEISNLLSRKEIFFPRKFNEIFSKGCITQQGKVTSIPFQTLIFKLSSGRLTQRLKKVARGEFIISQALNDFTTSNPVFLERYSEVEFEDGRVKDLYESLLSDWKAGKYRVGGGVKILEPRNEDMDIYSFEVNLEDLIK